MGSSFSSLTHVGLWNLEESRRGKLADLVPQRLHKICIHRSEIHLVHQQVRLLLVPQLCEPAKQQTVRDSLFQTDVSLRDVTSRGRVLLAQKVRLTLPVRFLLFGCIQLYFS